MREDYYAGLEDRYFLTFEQSKEQKLKIDFDASPPPPTPNKLGLTVMDNVTLEDVVPFIDWVRIALQYTFCFVVSEDLPHKNLNPFSFSYSIESILPNLGTPWSLSKQGIP
jgi:cobalamin-dependent methionine synthase I